MKNLEILSAFRSSVLSILLQSPVVSECQNSPGQSGHIAPPVSVNVLYDIKEFSEFLDKKSPAGLRMIICKEHMGLVSLSFIKYFNNSLKFVLLLSEIR